MRQQTVGGAGRFVCLLTALPLVLGGCSDTRTSGGVRDGGRGDSGPLEPPSTDHCAYEVVPTTGGAGGSVTAGPLSAGTDERPLDLPLGASLAAYTGRAEGAGGEGFLPAPDERRTQLSGSFAPSAGIETRPMIRSLALSNDDETVVIIKVDLASSYQAFLHEVEAQLGPEFSGKVIVAASHSHSSFGNYSGHAALAVGFGEWRADVYERIVEQLTASARAALDRREPARIGFAHDADFDPFNQVTRDRRPENDELAGGPRKDEHLYLVRVDTAAGEPLAVLPIFGLHGTVHGGRNPLLSTDAIGGIERAVEESFDREVLVMHLQGSAGDVAPVGASTTDCRDQDVCADLARPETIGRAALRFIRPAWERAGLTMESQLEMEMVTRTVRLGPDWRTFTIRDGLLEYAPFDPDREADGIVFDEDGQLVSPIDEFNAPTGAALCSTDLSALLPRAQMPGTLSLPEYPYFGCNRLEAVDGFFEAVVNIDFEEPPLCESTRTTISALRIGRWVFATLPGESTTMLAEHLRQISPAGPENTVIVGYAQDHNGYLLRPEDWLAGGYEVSITFWGPLEGEYVAEQSADLIGLAMTPEREDGNAGGTTRVTSPARRIEIPRDSSPIASGTIPDELPEYVFTRRLLEPPAVQPAPQVPRLRSAYFTWVGDDPLVGTPRVVLQRETETEGEFEDVRRRSGRVVSDGDLIVTWTPSPISRAEGVERTHYYTVEFEAVPPFAMPGFEEISQRRQMPLGRYRFRIEGPRVGDEGEPTYEIVSDPFEVTPIALRVAGVEAGGDTFLLIGIDEPNGYRLIRENAVADDFARLRSQEVTVELEDDSGEVTSMTMPTDDQGMLRLSGIDSAGYTALEVIDGEGRRGAFAF